ncbi:glutathione binding-like protein [Microvirga aerophila]|uniref:GST C-terminal domain-containing protein n=1 Tax=Microvirga aerophila TaxID=670291 RepID=A0A512BSR9_9HYPH|nr:glutathione binding-like protein [Microvirga aerophila]GEO15030.1 hypothetical protein MAE02_27260 [Microvirga aerophila]
MDRYRVQEWLNFISTKLHGSFMPLWRPASSAAERQSSIDNLYRLFGYLDGHLADRPYLLGKQFTVADAYGFTVLNWTHFHRISLAKHPWLLAYMKRVAARPGVKEAMGAEGVKALC